MLGMDERRNLEACLDLIAVHEEAGVWTREYVDYRLERLAETEEFLVERRNRAGV